MMLVSREMMRDVPPLIDPLTAMMLALHAAAEEDRRLTEEIGPLHLPARIEVERVRATERRRARKGESARDLVRALRSVGSFGRLRLLRGDT